MTMKKVSLFVLSDLLPGGAACPRNPSWTEEFLLSFNPAERRSTQAAPPNPVVARVFQTGTVPISNSGSDQYDAG